MASSFVPMLGGASIAPALPAIKQAFASTPNAALLTGLVLSTHALAILLLSPWAGYVGDRFGRRPALLLGLGIFGVAGTSAFYLPDLPSILAGRFVLGVSIALIMTSVTGLIGDLFDPLDRQTLLGQQAAAATAGGVLFMLAAGALASIDWRTTFLIYAVGWLMILPVLGYVPAVRATRSQHQPESPGGEGSRSRLGGWLLVPTTAVFVLNLMFYVIPVQVPGLMADEYAAGPLMAGMAMAAMSLTMAPSALMFSRLRPRANSATLVAASFASPVCGFAVMAAASDLLELVAGMMLLAVGIGLASPALNNWVVSIAPAEKRGRAIGILLMGVFLGQFLSPVVTQPIVTAIGLRPVFGILAAVSLCGGVAFALIARSTPAEEACR